MRAPLDTLAPYLEFSRVGFVNILAFRLRYFTGIITYTLNVIVYYFIWSAVYHPGQSIAGYNLQQMITYISVGWIIRSFYTNTIDQEMAYEVIEGKIAMDLIKPISVQGMWISRAMGESAFRLGLLTLPTAVVVAFVFPVQAPASRRYFLLFLIAVLGSFLLMSAINFMIGTCAVPLKSILALIRATLPTRHCKSIWASSTGPRLSAPLPRNGSGWRYSCCSPTSGGVTPAVV
jgi:ABC-2 type transport system permease protein